MCILFHDCFEGIEACSGSFDLIEDKTGQFKEMFSKVSILKISFGFINATEFKFFRCIIFLEALVNW